MTDDTAEGFTAGQAAEATTALRAALGLPPQVFGVGQFVAMLSDEIDLLREAGNTDADIATILHQRTGITLSAEHIGRHHASPGERGE